MAKPAFRRTAARTFVAGTSIFVLTLTLGMVCTNPAWAEPGPDAAVAGTTAAADAGGAAAAAAPSGPCADAYPIGRTGYVHYRGAVVASVKQYYSPTCRKNWGYVWVWESFRDTGVPYDVGVAVYSYTSGQQYGNQFAAGTRRAAFWSGPANTVRHCTAGFGTLIVNGTTPADGYSSRRCY